MIPFLNEHMVVDLKTIGNQLPEELRIGVQAARNASAFAIPRRSQLYVGSAVLDDKDMWHAAGTVETLWQRSHHAEENAIMCGLARGARQFKLIFVSAPRELFTPCGSCCDLIMEFGTDECFVLHDNPETEVLSILKKSSLMPFYPTRK